MFSNIHLLFSVLSTVHLYSYHSKIFRFWRMWSSWNSDILSPFQICSFPFGIFCLFYPWSEKKRSLPSGTADRPLCNSAECVYVCVVHLILPEALNLCIHIKLYSVIHLGSGFSFFFFLLSLFLLCCAKYQYEDDHGITIKNFTQFS